MSEKSPAGKAVSFEIIEESLYEIRRKIYPRSVSGVFARWRVILVLFTQLLFYGLPWLSWNGRQAVLFDLIQRKFYIFGLVLWPQDVIYLTLLLILSALALFLFTAVAGRLFCGYACPQTVYTEIFMWIERRVEGDRFARIRLDGEEWPWSVRKWRIKITKHFLWLAVSFWTGFTFIGYFTPIDTLSSALAYLDLGPWQTFWLGFYSFATWGNAGFMREQVCKYMCPYARFQSAMFDHDTLIVTYDSERGDPRGARSRKADLSTLQLGACVDCSLCVQVCPTGIDIRNGLQYECIGCGACADVCDGVMDKMGYARGLVRYTTKNAMENKWTPRQMWSRLLRPRVQIYGMLLVALVVGLLVSLGLRTPFKVDVVRDRATLARITEYGTLENIYRLQIMNAAETEQTYHVSAQGLSKLRIETETVVVGGPAQARWIVLRADIPYGSAESGSHKIQFEIQAQKTGDWVVEKSVFIVPR